MYATNELENRMLGLMASTNMAAVTPYLALFLSNPGETGTEGTEASYSGYARQSIAFSAPATSGSGLSMQNTAQISFPEASAAGGTVKYVGVYDSLTGGNLLLYGELNTSLEILAGVSPVFRIGAVQWIWSGSLATYYRTAIMNTFRGTAVSGFTPYVGFCAGNPEDTGAEVTIGENNYARIACAMSAPSGAAVGAGLYQNTSEILSNVSTGSWGSINYAALYDGSTVSAHRFAVFPLGTTYSIPTGTAVGFHAGDLQFSVN